ncbi:MAG: hypothetical protein HYT82_00975 [Candidatus Harrisonbacteria bacterium]|nr:hypothetical protein [Candidatus Harrisonbacteria bacterium]
MPHYIFGNTVLVQGHVFEGPGKIIISLNNDVCFIKGPKFSSQGSAYLREARDILRKATDWSLEVTVHDPDDDLAKKYSELIAQDLEKSLYLKEGKISQKQYSPSDGYVRVEITATR